MLETSSQPECMQTSEFDFESFSLLKSTLSTRRSGKLRLLADKKFDSSATLPETVGHWEGFFFLLNHFFTFSLTFSFLPLPPSQSSSLERMNLQKCQKLFVTVSSWHKSIITNKLNKTIQKYQTLYLITSKSNPQYEQN